MLLNLDDFNLTPRPDLYTGLTLLTSDHVTTSAKKLIQSSETIFGNNETKRAAASSHQLAASFATEVSKKVIQVIPDLSQLTPEQVARALNPAVMSQIKAEVADGMAGYTMGNTEGTILSNQIKQLAGFVSRPDAAMYQNLFTSGNLKASIFQFQNQEVVAALLQSNFSFQIAMQAASKVEDKIGAQILNPNELTLEAVKQRALLGDNTTPDNKVIREAYGVYSAWTFHAKLGVIYQGDNVGRLGFISTQNITSATSKANTLESLLLLREGASVFETLAVREIEQFTDSILDLARQKSKDGKDKKFVAPGDFVKQLSTNKVQPKFLYTDTSILDRFISVVSTARNTMTDKVFISMNEMGLLLRNEHDNRIIALKEDLIVLAKEDRLTLVASNKDITEALSDLYTKVNTTDRSGQTFDKEFLKILVDTKSITAAPTSYFHDKTIAVFNKSNEIKFLSVGSANMTADSLMAIADIKSTEFKDQVRAKMLQAGFSEAEIAKNLKSKNTAGTEIVMAIGSDAYKDLNRNISDIEHQATEEYLLSLAQYSTPVKPGYTPSIGNEFTLENRVHLQPLLLHFNTLAGGKLFTNNDLNRKDFQFNKGYGLDNYQKSLIGKSFNQSKLKTLYLRLQEKVGDENVKLRFNVDKSDAPVGIRLHIPSAMSGEHSLTLDLGINTAGEVIILDLNKIINGSIFSNKTADFKTLIVEDETDSTKTKTVILNSSESIRLSSFDTTLALVDTFRRAALNQQVVGLTHDVFNTFYSNRFNTLTKITSNWVEDNLFLSYRKIKGNSGVDFNFEHFFSLPILERREIVSEFVKSIQDDPIQLTTLESKEDRKDFVNSLAIINNFSNASDLDDFTHYFLDRLSEDKIGLYSDIKKELINSDYQAKEHFSNAAKAQSRGLLTYLTSPFLAAHEQNYGFYQASARVPVYGEDALFADNEYGKILEKGLLNPLPLTHATQVGVPGQYFRSVGNVAYGQKLSLPGQGALKQLRTVESDLSSDVAIVYEMKTLLQSMPSVALLTSKQLATDISEVTGKTVSETELLDELKSDTLYYFSFPKEDQIPQRLKNLLGQKPSQDVSRVFVSRMLRGLGVSREYLSILGLQDVNDNSTKQWFEHTDYLQSKLRSGMPELQFQKLKKVIQEFSSATGAPPTLLQLEEYFKERQLDPLNTEKGFLEPQKLKRVAIQTTMSTLGDYAIANSQYSELPGAANRVRLKINPGDINNIEYTQAIMSHALDVGTFATSAPLKLESPTLVMEGSKIIKDFVPTEKGKGTSFELEQGLYKDYGLNEAGQRVLAKVGRYTTAGEFELIDTFKQKTNQSGTRYEPILFKMPAFAKRYQEGIAVITSPVNYEISSRGTHIVEFDSLVWFSAKTGVRQTGSIKAPMLFTTDAPFKEIEHSFNSNDRARAKNNASQSYRALMPQDVREQSIYQLTHFGTFKSFNFEAGLSILSDTTTREELKRMSRSQDTSDRAQVARTIALAFMGDKQVTEALSSFYERQGDYQLAYGLKLSTGSDVSKIKDGAIGKVATGLLVFGEGDTITDKLSNIKQNVIAALSDLDGVEARRLNTQLEKLITLAEGRSINIDGGKLIFSQQDTVVKGAGIFAQLAFFERQVFANRSKRASGLYEVSFGLTDLYKGNVAKIGNLESGHYRVLMDSVAKSVGLRLDSEDKEGLLDSQLQMLQELQDASSPIENIVDVSISQSLVPTGLKDSVRLEYQYMLGMSKQHIDSFRGLGKGLEKSQETYSSYLLAMGLTRGDMLGTIVGESNKKIEYRLAFHSPSEKGLLDDDFFKIRQALLSFSEKFSDRRQYSEALLSGASIGSIENLTKLGTNLSFKLTSETDDYLAAINYLNTEFKQNEFINDERAKSVLSEISTTRQVILPKFEEVYDAERGQYKVRFRPFEMAEPTIGVILGSDILSTAAVSFGNYKDDIVTTQTQLMDLLIKNKDTLERIWNSRDTETPIFLNETELLELRRLEQQIEASPKSLVKVADTETARRAFGDHEHLTGVNAIAVNSLALAPDQYLAGSRFDSLNKDMPLTKTLRSITDNIIDLKSLGGDQLRTTKAIDNLLTFLSPYNQEDGARRKDSLGIKEVLNLLKTPSHPRYERQLQYYRTKLIEVKAEALWETRESVRSANPDKEKYITKILDKADHWLQNKGRYTPLTKMEASQLILSKALSSALDVSGDYSLSLLETDRLGKTFNLESVLMRFSRASIARSGMPTGMSSLISENDLFKGISLETFSESLLSLTEGKGKLLPDKHKLTTGLIVPSVSRLIAGLGDYDGDTYRFVLTNLHNRTAETKRAFELKKLIKAKNELVQLETYLTETIKSLKQTKGAEPLISKSPINLASVEKIISLFDGYTKSSTDLSNAKALLKLKDKFPLKSKAIDVSILNNLKDLGVTSKRYDSLIKENIEASQEMLSAEAITADTARKRQAQNKYLQDLDILLKNYFQLPKYLGDSLTTGGMIGLLGQKYDTSKLSDSSERVAQALARYSEATKVFANNTSNLSYSKWAQIQSEIQAGRSMQSVLGSTLGMTKEDELFYKGFIQELVNAKSLPTSEKAQEEFVRSYVARAVSVGQPAEEVSSFMKKAAGSILNPFEFDSVTKIIGLGGSSVLGQAYNTFLPLIDTPMLSSALVSVTNMLDGSDPNEFDYLPKSILDSLRTTETKTALKEQYHGTVALLGDIQQAVRDSLKPKSSSGILHILNETLDIDDKQMTLGEYLNQEDPVKSPIIQDKEKLQVLSKVLYSKIGTDLGRGSFLTSSSIDYGVTGIGALANIATYVTTRDRDFTSTFFDDNTRDKISFLTAYEQSLAHGSTETMKEFVEKHIVSQVQRSQASYLVSRIDDDSLEKFKAEALAFKSNIDRTGATPTNEYDMAQYRAIESYDPNVNSNKQLIGELILKHIEYNHKTYDIFSVKVLQNLREASLAKQDILNSDFGLGDRISDSNKFALNQMTLAFRTNKHLDIEMARGLATLTIQNLAGALQEFGDTTSTEGMGFQEAARRALLHGMIDTIALPGTSKEDRLGLVNNLLADGAKGLSKLAEHSALLSQVMSLFGERETLSEFVDSQKTASDRAFQLEMNLKGLLDSGEDNRIDPKYARKLFITTAPENIVSSTYISKILQGVTSTGGGGGGGSGIGNEVYLNSAPQPSNKLIPEGMIEHGKTADLIGVFASPLAFALVAGGELKFDERAASFALDTYQGFVMQSAIRGSLTERLGTYRPGEYDTSKLNELDSSKVARQFQIARITSAIATEGALIGALQGTAQELLFSGLGEVTTRLFTNHNGKYKFLQFLGSAAAEVIGSALSAGLSRAMTGARGYKHSESFSESPLLKLLNDGAEQLWRRSEDTLISQLETEYEVIDTDTNTNLSFDLSAIPQDYEQDIDSGLIVLDADNINIHTQFENYDSSSMKSVQTLAKG